MRQATDETWREVPGYDGAYEVSDEGRVRSVDRVVQHTRRCQYSGKVLTYPRMRRGVLLRPFTTPAGHLQVMLGRGKHMLVHVAVLLAFVGPRPKGLECCHRDDDPKNNRPRNLYWGTRSQNLHDAVRNGKKATGSRTKAAKLKEADIPVIRRLRETTMQKDVAAMFGVSSTTIHMVERGKTWKGV